MFLKAKPRANTSKNPVQRMTETCANPWNHKCKNTDIVLSIVVKGQTLPICSRCWSEIADSNREW